MARTTQDPEGNPQEKPNKAAPIKLPKSLAACADLYSNIRDARLAKQKETDALEEQEKFVKDYLINNIPKSEATGVAGKIASVSIVRKKIAQVKNWDEYYKFILKTKDFSLLNRSANRKAIEERWEAGKTVPGTEAFDTVTLSLHKIK